MKFSRKPAILFAVSHVVVAYDELFFSAVAVLRGEFPQASHSIFSRTGPHTAVPSRVEPVERCFKQGRFIIVGRKYHGQPADGRQQLLAFDVPRRALRRANAAPR